MTERLTTETREARWLIAAIVFEALGFISLGVLGVLLVRSL